MINIIPESENKLSDKQSKEYEQLLQKIAELPEQERIKVDAYATGLADAARFSERKSA